MKRMTKKEIAKKDIGILIFSICFILAGIFMMYYCIITLVPDCSQLKSEKITIVSIEEHHNYRSGTSYSIIASNGTKYGIAGAYDRENIINISENTSANIKYYNFGLLFKKDMIEELTIEEEKIVTYTNENASNILGFSIFSFLIIAIGICGIFIYRYSVKHYTQLQRKRDKRIEKKFGKIKK